MRGATAIRGVAIAVLLLRGSSAWADEYNFIFDPGSAQFVESQADNRANVGRVLSLIQDFGGTHGIQFVLLGEVPEDCLADLKCSAAALLRHRVEAVSGSVIALSGSGKSVQALRWQPIAPATPHLEGLRLRIRDFASQVFSAQCPYHVQLSDPRLPMTIAPDGPDQVWATVVGSAPVPVTDRTSIRVRSGSASQAELAAKQFFKEREAMLGSGSEQIQWSAGQFSWEDGAAEVIVEERLVSRDIGNELLPWNTDSSSPSSPASDAAGCRINFQLLQPHDR